MAAGVLELLTIRYGDSKAENSTISRISTCLELRIDVTLVNGPHVCLPPFSVGDKMNKMNSLGVIVGDGVEESRNSSGDSKSGNTTVYQVDSRERRAYSDGPVKAFRPGRRIQRSGKRVEGSYIVSWTDKKNPFINHVTSTLSFSIFKPGFFQNPVFFPNAVNQKSPHNHKIPLHYAPLYLVPPSYPPSLFLWKLKLGNP